MDVNPLAVEFDLLITMAGLTRAEAAQYLGLSPRTIDRYCQHGPPLVAVRALEYRAGIAEGWEQHYFRPKYMRTPTGQTVTESELHDFVWTKNLYESLTGGRQRRRFNGVKPEGAEVIDITHITRYKAGGVGNQGGGSEGKDAFL